jgi:Ca2+-binding RTX toxin-like protein
MSEERVSLASSFNLTFQINVGNDDNGADGMAFVLHNDPLGNHALGGGGGAMGALNLHNGLAIQFDTFQNAGDPNDIANDHTSFMDTDSEAVLSPITDLGNIEDGNWHTVGVSWDGTTLSYTFDGNLAGTLTGDIAADYLGGSQYAYFGITGATGGLSHPGDVRLVSLDATAEDGSRLSLDGSTTSTSGPNLMVGDETNNTITGTAGADLILGLAGNDSLHGGDGNDTISGGTGNDTLTGDAGNDTFVFAPGFGFDTITDFHNGAAGNIDLLDFSAFGFASELEILQRTHGADADTVFDFGNGDVLIVANTAAGGVTNLTHNDFIV